MDWGTFSMTYVQLCGSPYTLFYFQVVITIEASTAGTLLMIGQVVDSLATPLAGWAIDYVGHRRLWHLGGTLAVSIGFSLIFSMRPTEFSSGVLLYYVLVVTLFQIGWAVVQISHLSIIPEISRSHSHSSDLTAIRYTASVCCSISVYLITLIVLKNNGEVESIGPNDFFKFKEIALIITFIGILASMLFYCGLLATYENEYDVLGGSDVEDVNNLSNQNGKHFLKSSLIYCVSMMYMSSRLFTILNLIYIPLYIDERGALDASGKERIRQTIASVPLVSYIASFVTAVILKFVNGICNDKIVYCLGTLIGLSASIWMGVGVPSTSDMELYGVASLLGICGSSTMIASLCLTANFVKANGYGGGLVYSVVTFTDKLISGVVVLLVQSLQCSPKSLCPHFYQHVLTYICGVVSLVGLSSLITLELQIRKNMRQI